MEKMNQKYICKITRRGMAFYLAILMVLVVLPLSCGGAEEPCMHYYIKRENGKDSQVSYIDYEYYDSQYHRKYCTNCGEDFGLFEHIRPFGIGYDIATYVDQKTHKFYCKTCKTTVFENHVINSVDHCRYCAYSVPKEKYGKSTSEVEQGNNTELPGTEQPAGSGNETNTEQNTDVQPVVSNETNTEQSTDTQPVVNNETNTELNTDVQPVVSNDTQPAEEAKTDTQQAENQAGTQGQENPTSPTSKVQPVTNQEEKKTEKNYNTGISFVLPKKADKNAYECNYVADGEEQSVQVQILGLARSYIFIDGVPTFVNTSDLELADGVAQDQMLVYIKAGSHARLYTDTDFKKSIGLCDPGMILPVLSVGNYYVEVQYNGKTGYLKRSSCELCAPVKGLGTGIIDNGKQSVNIRQTADVTSTKITSVKPGAEITILSENGNWYEVEYFGLHGYVRKEFVKFKEKGFGGQSASVGERIEDGGYIGEAVKDGVNLRKKANKNSGLVRSMKKGEKAEILSEETGKDGKTWYYCSVDGKTGYVRSDMLRITGKDNPGKTADPTEKAAENSKKTAENPKAAADETASAGGQTDNPPAVTVTDEDTEDMLPEEDLSDDTIGEALPDEDWKKAYYEYLVGGGFQYRKTPREDNDRTYWTDRFGVEYCMDGVNVDGVKNFVKFALYDWDRDGAPELFSYDAASEKGIGDYHVYTFRNGQMGYLGKIGTGYSTGIDPYRDDTRNVIFSSYTSGNSTEVFYASLDSENNARMETLIATQYIDKGDDQPGEWEITGGPADQELYDLFRARYGEKQDYFFTEMPFKEVVGSVDDVWWNGFVNNYRYVYPE